MTTDEHRAGEQGGECRAEHDDETMWGVLHKTYRRVEVDIRSVNPWAAFRQRAARPDSSVGLPSTTARLSLEGHFPHDLRTPMTSNRPEPTGSVRSRSAFVAAAILLMAASFVVIKTGRDALYFQGSGLFDLPKAYIVIAVLSVPFAFATLALMRRLGPRAARIATPLAVSAGLIATSGWLHPGGGIFMTGVFVFVPLAYGVMFSLSWLLAADLLDGVDRRALASAYGMIGAGSIVGGVLGALAAKALAMRVSPTTLVRVGAVLLAGSAATMLVAQLRYPAHVIGAQATGRAPAVSLRGILKHRYALLLLAVASLASLTGIFVEFQFYLAASTSNNTGQENANFFANLYLALNLGALVVQLYLMPKLQRWLGVHGSLLIMPIAILGGAAVLISGATPFMRSGLKATEGGLKASIHRSNWEQAYLPVSSEQRAAAKLIIDGAAARVAEGVAAIALYVWLATAIGEGGLAGQQYRWISYAIAATALLWAFGTRALRRATRDLAVPSSDGLRVDLPLPDT